MGTYQMIEFQDNDLIHTEFCHEAFGDPFSAWSGGAFGMTYKQPAQHHLEDGFDHLRYADNPQLPCPPDDFMCDSWSLDMTCRMNDDILDALRNPPTQSDSNTRAVTCINRNTAQTSSSARYINRIHWDSTWNHTYPRLWVGYEAGGNGHGDYCEECIAMWTTSSSGICGIYSAPSDNDGSAADSNHHAAIFIGWDY